MKTTLYICLSSLTLCCAPISAFDCADLQESIGGDISGVQECVYTNSKTISRNKYFCNFFFLSDDKAWIKSRSSYKLSNVSIPNNYPQKCVNHDLFSQSPQSKEEKRSKSTVMPRAGQLSSLEVSSTTARIIF
jgi:hypothetical protein